MDEQGSEHHGVIAAAESIEQMPVVLADLHSALPAILAGVLADRPGARVAYVMTDGGALPLWFSRTVSDLAPLLCGTVTVGPHETVNLAFRFGKTGLASAAAVVLLLIILLVTWIQRRLVPDDKVDLV